MQFHYFLNIEKMNDNFLESIEFHDDLLAELQDHKSILDAFRDLPKVLKKHVLSFFRTRITNSFCPVCGCGWHSSYCHSLPHFSYYMCEHNYYPISTSENEDE